MFLGKNFIRNFFALFFYNIYEAFSNDLFFYLKSIVRLFKLINAFSSYANSLAPSYPIELYLNFVINKMFLAKDFIRNFFALFFHYL